MRPLEEKKKTFKASHFENIQELLDTCKMWIRDDDYDAYCRFFDMGAMEELLNELEKKDKIIKNQSYTNKKMRKKLDGYRKLLKLKEKHLSKEYKIIDAMALQLSGISIWDDQKEEPIILISEEAVKKYYERKVENG